MSDFGIFESDEAAQSRPQVQARTAARKMDAAIDVVRAKFGRFLLGATGVDEFSDRWHYSKHDIRASVEPYIFPNTGTMRRLHNALKQDWKIAHPYKLALEEGETPTGGPLEGPVDLFSSLPEGLRPQSEDDLDMPMVDKITQQYHDDPFRKHGPELDPAAGHAGFGEFSRLGPDSWDYDAINRMTDARQEHERGRTSTRRHALDHDDAGFGSMPTGDSRRNQDLDETYHPSSGNLVPEGDFEGYKNSVDQDGPAKVESNDFTPGGDSGSDKQARRRQATEWKKINNDGYPAGADGGNMTKAERDQYNAEQDEKHGLNREAAKLVADIYTDFARSNGMRVASLDTLDRYASTGIHEADYRLLQSMILRTAECDESCDDDESPSASEGDENEESDSSDSESDFGGESDSEDDDSDSDSDDDDESDEDDSDDDDDDDYGFGDDDEDDEGGQEDGQTYTVPEQAPDLDPQLLNEIPHDDPQGAAPVPPEVVDSLLGLPPGTIEQLLLEEVEQGQGGAPQPGGPEQGAPQGGGDDFFGGGGDDTEQEPPRVARRRQAKDYGRKCSECKSNNTDYSSSTNDYDCYDCGATFKPYSNPKKSPEKESRRRSARSFWAAEGDPEQESEGGGGEQAAPAQDPAAAMGGDPAAMGGQPMMPPPGSQAVAPPAPPQQLENQPAEDALLDTANQAIMQMIDQETAEYQQIIDPLSQALQAIQFAQQVEQTEHPMDVTPPQGTVDVSPAAAPGGAANPMQQQASRQFWAAEDGKKLCYHPRSCPKCDSRGSACGAHVVGSEGHERCSGNGGRQAGPYDDGVDALSRDLGRKLIDEPAGRHYPTSGDVPWPGDLSHHLQGDPSRSGYDAGFDASWHPSFSGHEDPWQAAGDAWSNAGGQGSGFDDGWVDSASDIPHRHNDPQGYQDYRSRQSRRQAKVEFGIRNAAALIASRYRLSATGHQMLLSAALGRRGYEHVVEALRLVPPEVRKAAAIHMKHLFAAGNDRFNGDVFMKTVMAGTARERYQDKAYSGPRDKRRDEHGRQDQLDWFSGPDDGTDTPYRGKGADNGGPDPVGINASRGRLPFELPRRTAGETMTPTSTMDAFEFPLAGQVTRIDDNNDFNNLPQMTGADPHGKNATSQKAVDRFRRWQQRQQQMGLSTTEGESAVHNFLQTGNPAKKRVGPDAQNMIHRELGLTPDAVKTPSAKPVKAVNPVLKGKGGTTPKAPEAKSPAPKAAPKTASFFTRRVPGWRWDDHLAGYISKEGRAFTCSCGDQVSAPSYKTCKCGKIWNVYAIGDTHHLASDSADMFIAREIPVRDNVIMANRKLAKGDCQCWDGYERVPGTKPCAEGSCRKCDSHRKESRKSHRELVAEIERLADWTKYDGPDPTRDPKVKPPSTTIKSQPGDWTNRDFTGPTKGQWREPEPTELPRKTRKKK